MPTVSVIVPVYKVEPFLKECVDSILNQTFNDFELILVDDGSPDGCPVMCDEFARADKRIVVIHKENGGLSSARNAGLNVAKGRYVLFVDSDDYIKKELLSTCIQKIQETGADIVRFGYTKIRDDRSVIHNTQLKNNLYFFETGEDKLKFICESLLTFKIPFTAWSALYDNNIIKTYNLRFPNEREIYSEDSYFSTLYSFYSSCCVTISEIFYIYRLNQFSLMGTYRANKTHQINKCICWSKNLFSECNNIVLKNNFYMIAITFYKTELAHKTTKDCILYNIESIKMIDDKTYFKNQNKMYLKNVVKSLPNTIGKFEAMKEKAFYCFYTNFNVFLFKARILLFNLLKKIIKK